MFRLAYLREEMTAYAAAFDADLVSAEDAAAVVRDAAAIEKMAATVKTLAAAREAETSVWQREGDATAAHYLARKSGTGVSQAKEMLEAGRQPVALPKVAAAARRGELSPQQLSAVADAASTAPDAEERLVE